MDELARIAAGGDEVIPAAGDVGVRIEAEDASGDRIAVVMIVEEPAVELRGAKGGLNGFQLHGESIRHLRGGTKRLDRPACLRSLCTNFDFARIFTVTDADGQQ